MYIVDDYSFGLLGIACTVGQSCILVVILCKSKLLHNLTPDLAIPSIRQQPYQTYLLIFAVKLAVLEGLVEYLILRRVEVVIFWCFSLVWNAGSHGWYFERDNRRGRPKHSSLLDQAVGAKYHASWADNICVLGDLTSKHMGSSRLDFGRQRYAFWCGSARGRVDWT